MSGGASECCFCHSKCERRASSVSGVSLFLSLSVILLVVATKARRRDGLEEVEVAAEGCVCLSLYGEEAEIVGVERGKSEPEQEQEPAQVCSCLVL